MGVNPLSNLKALLGRTVEQPGGLRLQPLPVNPTVLPLPLYGSRIAAGFPSPADDFLEKAFDLNEHLVQHPAATFFVQVQGHSMTGAGIHHGDLLIVDRSLEPKDNAIVISLWLTVK